MDPVLLLVNSSPSSATARRALQMAQTLQGQGHPVTLFLLQDGVLAARHGEPALDELSPDVTCYALKEDLRLRGYAAPDLRAQVEIAGYAQLVELFDQNARVIGAL